MRSIQITVSKDGEVIIEAIGYRGNSCAKATEAMERALGLAKKKQLKPEFHMQTETQQKVGGK